MSFKMETEVRSMSMSASNDKDVLTSEPSKSQPRSRLKTEPLSMKCRKCRQTLLIHPQVKVLDSHGVEIKIHGESSSSCKSEVWYIPEDYMPDWLSPLIEKGGWVKGKVNCPKCDSRLGVYNFIGGLKCPCGSQVVAPVHIVKSKVDFHALHPQLHSSLQLQGRLE